MLSVGAEDAGGGIGSIYADLSSLGGEAETALLDDGTGGDEQAGDGVYSVGFDVAGDAGGGLYTIPITATDASGIAMRSTEAALFVTTEAEIFISAEDAVGDDHGPNLRGVTGLYYRYPTEGVFKDGVFDLRGIDLMIDGRNLVFRVRIGNVLSNAEVSWSALHPGNRCNNPNKAQFNLQKIDIYMDAADGVGSTAGFPFRFVDIADHDAWEYGVAVEGWWVGLVQSNGENQVSKWTLKKNENDIYICNDHVEEYVDIIVNLEALDLLAPDEEMDAARLAEIQSELRQWDYIITMAGHDGDSNNSNLGAIRWVNRSLAPWQFGGGADTEAGRDRDPNLIDVLAIAGEGSIPGRSQEQVLNYLTAEAGARFDSGLNSCVLEATPEFEGMISGTVTLSDPTDTVTVATVRASRAGEVFATTETHPGGGTYVLEFLPDGNYAVSASAPYYLGGTIPSVTIEDGGSIENVDLELAATTGTIAGEVTLSDPEDMSSVVTVTAYLDGEAVKAVEAPPGGGRYELRFLAPGSYTVEATARTYRTEILDGIAVTAGSFSDDRDFALTLVTGAISGTVSLSGPEMDARVFVVDASTDGVVGDSAIVVEGGDGPFEFLIIEDGSHHIIAEARGYRRFEDLVTVENGDTASVDVEVIPCDSEPLCLHRFGNRRRPFQRFRFFGVSGERDLLEECLQKPARRWHLLLRRGPLRTPGQCG